MELKIFCGKLLTISYGMRHAIMYYKLVTNPWRCTPKLVLKLLTNVLLGCIVYAILNSFLVNRDVSNDVIALATTVKTSLDELLRWLMGAPAGLKLNDELSYFLGNFFLYHVQIWMTYIMVISHYLPTVTMVVTLTNFLGVSMFLAALMDVINGLTFHLYCFYVYASKLYHVQLKALVSLQRLFRGKKWNVLRLRVDSVTYQADQLILGTILFTILLFLLPTTLLYYVVFSSIHIVILCVQTVLSFVVQWLEVDGGKIVAMSNEDGDENLSCSQKMKMVVNQLLQGDIINLSR